MRRLILGPPGTGKTTTMLGIVEEALGRGVAPERIAFLSFTRAAAQEAIDRAASRFDLPAERFRYFRTLHSLAYHLLQLRREEVMGADQWREFGRIHGYDFRTELFGEDAPAGAQDLGDKLAQCYQLSRARCWPIEAEWNAGRYDFPDWAAVRFVAQLRAYKSQHGLLDFADFLDGLNAHLDVDLMILDEAQDLTRQQWGLFDRLSAEAPDVYIAGDDDQAIFDWAGADVGCFLALKHAQTVLPKSHRLPRVIKTFADSIVSRIAHRFPKQWASREEEGRLSTIGSQHVEVGDGSWLLLARTNGGLASLESFARDSGRVYYHRGRWSNDTPVARAILGWSRLGAGRRIEARLWNDLTRFCDLRLRPGVGSVGRDGVGPSEVLGLEENCAPWYAALRLNPDAVAYHRALLRRGERLDGPGSVRLSTIHRAKGMEADNVVLLGKSGADPYSDSERRVWYVGATRARSMMYLVNADRNPLLRGG